MKQILTTNRMQSFKMCRRKHYFEYELGLRQQVDARSLRITTAGRAALHALQHERSLVAALDALRPFYEPCPPATDRREWDYERETVACLIAGYRWRWGEPLTMIARPKRFQLPVINPKTGAASTIWDTAGQWDGIAKMPNGQTVVVKHRFTAEDLSSEGSFWTRQQLDHRVTHLLDAGRQLGHTLDGVLLDVIRKPLIRPGTLPMLDEAGHKVVIDRSGHRVFNPNGQPRQTAHAAKGFTLQTRPMTPLEWGEKLLEDIGQRPEFYYARQVISRRDEEIAEMQSEAWEVQQTIRDAQNKQRWFKTVSRDTCSLCSFLTLCTSQFDPQQGTPRGFVRLDDVHPELQGEFDRPKGSCCQPPSATRPEDVIATPVQTARPTGHPERFTPANEASQTLPTSTIPEDDIPF
ncbi:hypothetical protein [Bremerella cremea]|uniref:hypothetical protein n=1 Tax=Bremerella cremea TaxID=1031537 RepID=UPI0031E7D160